jgi:hypothetical protein
MNRKIAQKYVDSLDFLTYREQGDCVLMAAEPCLPLWRRWCQRNGKHDLSGILVESFQRWLVGTEPRAKLREVAKRFYKDLPPDLTAEDDLIGGYAGCVLFNVVVIALNQDKQNHPDVLTTAIFWAAAAHSGIGIEALWADPKRLTKPELRFIEEWWSRCRLKYPKLSP